MKKETKLLYGIWILDKKFKEDFYPLLSAGDDLEQGRAFIYRHKEQAKRALKKLKPRFKGIVLKIKWLKL